MRRLTGARLAEGLLDETEKPSALFMDTDVVGHNYILLLVVEGGNSMPRVWSIPN